MIYLENMIKNAIEPRKYSRTYQYVQYYHKVLQRDSIYHSLDGCYKKPSLHKELAYDNCKELVAYLKDCKGVHLINSGITSYNCHNFVFMILFEYEECSYLIVETYRNEKIYKHDKWR